MKKLHYGIWFPYSKIQERKSSMLIQDNLKNFIKNMMEVQSEEDAIWRREHIRYWEGYLNMKMALITLLKMGLIFL